MDIYMKRNEINSHLMTLCPLCALCEPKKNDVMDKYIPCVKAALLETASVAREAG